MVPLIITATKKKITLTQLTVLLFIMSKIQTWHTAHTGTPHTQCVS